LGIGFPPYTGGVFSYIDTVGIAQFVTDCDAFRELYGVRWQVPDSLRERTKDNRKFY
jgi:3-hydroxyacyl-CoA dehydrogenase/enoyl-CoA hydratase/3-hydroxybutyryl-CoA epimerase